VQRSKFFCCLPSRTLNKWHCWYGILYFIWQWPIVICNRVKFCWRWVGCWYVGCWCVGGGWWLYKINVALSAPSLLKRKWKIRTNRSRKFRRIMLVEAFNTNYSAFCRSRKQNSFVVCKCRTGKVWFIFKANKNIWVFCFTHFVFPVKINLCCHMYECKCTFRRMSH
jgi:hypothetical protein